MSRKKTLIIAGMLITLVAAVIIFLTSFKPSHEPSSESLTQESHERTDYTKLTGSWTRKTGGYVVKINKILGNGQTDAEYFNPRPIHVSRAITSKEDGILTLFIELRDQGYPGSTYALKYNPEYDALVGVYFQAVMQQSFDVVFIRKK